MRTKQRRHNIVSMIKKEQTHVNINTYPPTLSQTAAENDTPLMLNVDVVDPIPLVRTVVPVAGKSPPMTDFTCISVNRSAKTLASQ